MASALRQTLKTECRILAPYMVPERQKKKKKSNRSQGSGFCCPQLRLLALNDLSGEEPPRLVQLGRILCGFTHFAANLCRFVEEALSNGQQNCYSRTVHSARHQRIVNSAECRFDLVRRRLR